MSGVSSESLLKSSWSILKADIRILKTQLVGFLVMTLLGVAMVAGVFLLGDLTISRDEFAFAMTPASIVFYFAMYIAITFASSVVQATVLAYSLAKFRKQKLTASEVWSQVKQSMAGLALFSLLTATIGLALRLLEERLPLAGKIATWIFGAIWAIASMFSVAVIVDKKETDPIEATKESAKVIKNTFGSNVRVNLGLTSLALLGVLTVVVTGGLASVGLFLVAEAAGVAGIVLSFIALLGLLVVVSTLSGIIKAGLYEYSVSGKSPAEFNENLLKSAVTQKKARKAFRWS